MPFTPDLVEELNVLSMFNTATLLEGIKVHKTANPVVIAATQRLHDKGLVTQPDGGYLTDLGVEAAGHAQVLLATLVSE
jgi:uncharacterized protein (TIGR02647 family)